mmetsp:Transcript_24482/g.70562  ORF Transcript_24482/g.70562 Transcript_24482/m.70562 type:complete len:270 (-) Transcript_24482:115-924(-)
MMVPPHCRSHLVCPTTCRLIAAHDGAHAAASHGRQTLGVGHLGVLHGPLRVGRPVGGDLGLLLGGLQPIGPLGALVLLPAVGLPDEGRELEARRIVRRSGLGVVRVLDAGGQVDDGIANVVAAGSDLGLVVHVMEVGEGLLAADVAVHGGRDVAPAQLGDGRLALGDEGVLGGGGGVVLRHHPSVPLGADGGGIEVVDVARLDPSVLAEGIVDAVLVVLVPPGVDAHEGAELEGIVAVGVHVLEEALPPASVLQRLLDILDDSPDHDWI